MPTTLISKGQVMESAHDLFELRLNHQVNFYFMWSGSAYFLAEEENIADSPLPRLCDAAVGCRSADASLSVCETNSSRSARVGQSRTASLSYLANVIADIDAIVTNRGDGSLSASVREVTV